MKRFFPVAAATALSLLALSLAACSSNAPQASTALPQARGGVEPQIWEPPPVIASNGSDRNVTFTVTSPCSPIPYTPGGGTIDHGSTTNINFEPNGNACSYEEVYIKASDGNTTGKDDCTLLVLTNQINVESNENADCQLNSFIPGVWDFVYELVSGVKTRGHHLH